MVVFQSIAHNRFRNILTGAALLLLPGAMAVAQTSADEPLPNPRTPSSVESYSLPPGPDSTPQNDGLQGPADADIPLAQPPIVTPRTAPARIPPQSDTPLVRPSESSNSRQQQPTEPAPTRPKTADEIAQPEPELSETRPEAASDEPLQPPEVPTETIDPEPMPPEAATDPRPSATAYDWRLLLAGALFVLLLGAILFWRPRKASRKPSAAAEADHATTRLAKNPPPLDPVIAPVVAPVAPPVVAIGFRPHTANATLFNAVLAFELTLSNHGEEMLTGIRVFGNMVQAGEHGTGAPGLTDLSPLHEVANLPVDQSETIISEFRVPLTSIAPIVFRSQALFVPQVQISIEFTDSAGFQHFQTAAYLVGQEHQPPRQKMAPFRLDTGPRSFTPLGHRPLAAG
mgnify:FL=1|tara:strand:- start:117077 stop:118276 length:1200 start_codon:yes stop_codon:yes gene_type:complete